MSICIHGAFLRVLFSKRMPVLVQSVSPLRYSQCSVETLHGGPSRCHRLHPKTALPASGTGLGWPRTDTTVPVSDTQRWISNGCNYGADSRLGPPKGRPQNGGHLSIRNGPPKRCPPTVGGHTSGGVKCTSKSAPILLPSNQASFPKFRSECLCLRQQDSVRMVPMETADQTGRHRSLQCMADAARDWPLADVVKCNFG